MREESTLPTKIKVILHSHSLGRQAKSEKLRLSPSPIPGTNRQIPSSVITTQNHLSGLGVYCDEICSSIKQRLRISPTGEVRTTDHHVVVPQMEHKWSPAKRIGQLVPEKASGLGPPQIDPGDRQWQERERSKPTRNPDPRRIVEPLSIVTRVTKERNDVARFLAKQVDRSVEVVVAAESDGASTRS